MIVIVRKQYIIGILILLGLSLSFVPFDLTIAPQRKLTIIGPDNTPANKTTVRQIWYQYALKVNGEEDFKLNKDGYVVIPKRSTTTTIAKIISGAINNFKEVGIHASFSSTETVAIFSQEYGQKWFYDGEGISNGVIHLTSQSSSPAKDAGWDHNKAAAPY